MRALLSSLIAAALLGCSSCKSPDAAPPPATTSAPPAATTRTGPAAATRPGPPAAARPAAAGPARVVRVYVAGESIERRNHWVAPPFTATGALNERGGGEARNDDDEYGWAVPFADRVGLRGGGIKIQWVGSETWLDSEDNPYSGTYPPGGPGHTSALSGTSIESWLEQRRAELVAKKHCYDVAIAARGGNDFGLDDAAVGGTLTQLILLLAGGSSCQKRPQIYVTGHLPDDQRGPGEGPPEAAYLQQQRHRFVERFRSTVDGLRAQHPELSLQFVDLFTPFVENRPTTAFPREIWSRNGALDRAKIGRQGDRMHPRRLASIYAGELLADSIDLARLPP